MSDTCCKHFRKALNGRTDSEGFGSLVTVTDEGIYLGGMFNDEERITFCPWCGTQVGERRGTHIRLGGRN